MKKIIITVVAALIVIAAIGFVAMNKGVVKGNSSTVSTASLAVGTGCDFSYTTCQGSTIAQIIKGTGSLIASNYTSLAASTSLPFDIAVSNVKSGDLVFAQFATSSAAVAGWLITGASASSTDGYITVNVVNNTGTAATIPASIASTTQFLIIR